MILQHYYTQINSEPFSNNHVRKIIDRHIRRCFSDCVPDDIIMIDPFARNSFTTREHYCITNDLNEEMPTGFHLEANDFLEVMLDKLGPGSVDLIVFDPPYTLRQLRDLYENIGADLEIWQVQNMWGRAKDAAAKLLRTNGFFISLGYHTHGLGRYRGFQKEEIHIMESFHSPDAYDILVTVERKIQSNLLEFEEE